MKAQCAVRELLKDERHDCCACQARWLRSVQGQRGGGAQEVDEHGMPQLEDGGELLEQGLPPTGAVLAILLPFTRP